MVSVGLLKGCFGCVALGLLGSSAYFQASAITRLIACAHAPRASLAGRAPHRSPPERATAKAIVERNAFDSLTGPLVPKTQSLTAPDPDDPLSAPPCDGTQLYIVSESDDQRWSMATLQGTGEPRPRTRRIGDELASQRVEYIGFNPRQRTPAVWLSSGHALCQAVLFGKSPERAVNAVAVDPTERLTEPSSSRPEDPPERLRIVPELKAGKLLGVRLFGIQPKSAFAAIGLQSGDRLEAINGLAMDRPEHALQLYSTLRTHSDFHLRLVRHGRPLSITLHLK